MASAPTDLTLTAKSNGTDLLAQWTNTDTYLAIWVQYNKGSGWVTATQGLGGGHENYTLASVTVNTAYTVRVAGEDPVTGQWSSWSNTDSATCFKDALTETLSLGDTLGEVIGDYFQESVSLIDNLQEIATFVDSFTETLSISDFLQDAQTLRTNYAYYLINPSGGAYQLGGGKLGDGGANIPSTFQTKTTDFDDQHPEDADQFKTVYGARLQYVDVDADITVSVSYSTDGGATWVSKSRVIGTGDNKAKTADFHFIATANEFAFKVEHASSDAEFMITGLKIFYLPSGSYCEAA